VKEVARNEKREGPHSRKIWQRNRGKGEPTFQKREERQSGNISLNKRKEEKRPRSRKKKGVGRFNVGCLEENSNKGRCAADSLRAGTVSQRIQGHPNHGKFVEVSYPSSGE